MKRIFMVIAIFMLTLALAGSAAAYTYTSYDMTAAHTKMIQTPGGVYLLGYGGKDVQVERLVPSPAGATLNLRYPVDDVGVFDDTVIVICADRDNHQLVVYTYDIDLDILESFAVGGADFTRGFCYDGSGIWMINQNDRTVMNRYSRTGRMITSFSFPNNIGDIIDGGGCGYAVCAGAVYRLSGDHVAALSGARVNTPLCCIGGGMFSDVSGHVYQLNGNNLSLVYALESGSECASACIAGGSVYYPVGDVICRYDADGVKTGWFETDDTVNAMYADNGVICAVTDGGTVINRISPSEFTTIQKPTEKQQTQPDAEKTDGNSNNNSSNSNNNNGKDYDQNTDKNQTVSIISSDVYHVDNAAWKITGISSPTTFAKFKSRMKYDGYTARLYRDDKEVKSGSVGTAMQVVFSNDRNSYTYELSVTGDLTGEGNVNSRDIGDMMGYLLETVTYNGVYLDASDLNSDGRIDVADLALLCRMMK